jgi:hypothetical protein
MRKVLLSQKTLYSLEITLKLQSPERIGALAWMMGLYLFVCTLGTYSASQTKI